MLSVLLDAGAGPRWSYREAETGLTFGRSEGLAVASYRWFVDGGLSRDPRHDPLRVDAEQLTHVDRRCWSALSASLKTIPWSDSPGELLLLQRLGESLGARPDLFGDPPRPGNLALHLLEQASSERIAAPSILQALLLGLGPIWPGRERLGSVNLGDVWSHSRHGLVPFHKLSQWLAYSLCEPLAQAGARVHDLDGLTGLAEYRNGGLFLDGAVLVPKHEAVLGEVHAVGSDVVIEWRALTLALLGPHRARAPPDLEPSMPNSCRSPRCSRPGRGAPVARWPESVAPTVRRRSASTVTAPYSEPAGWRIARRITR